MLEKELAELFGLCQKVIKETDSYVLLETSSGIKYPSTNIYVIDNTTEEKHEFDGAYYIYDDEKLRESSLENYRKAREHLTRLLKEKGS